MDLRQIHSGLEPARFRPSTSQKGSCLKLPSIPSVFLIFKKRNNVSEICFLASFVLASNAFSGWALAEGGSSGYFLDWVPRNELSLEEQASLPAVCHGAYKTLSHSFTNSDATQLSAESADYLADGSIHLKGDVKIQSQSTSLLTGEAKFSHDRQRIQVLDGITLRQGGIIVHGDEGSFNLDDQQFNISNSEYAVLAGGLRGTASRISQTSQGEVLISDGSYTSCSPGDNSWRIVGKNIRLNRDTGFGTVEHAKLKLADLPVFYWPYFRFPIDDRRHTGLLTPSLSIGRNGVEELEQPFYLNIAPNADTTLSPRWYKERGVLLNSEFRWMVTENHYVEVSNSFFDNDPDYGADRKLTQLVLNGKVTDRWRYRVDYSEASDDYFLNDFEAGFTAVNTYELLQLAEAEGLYDNWQLIARVQGYQQLDPDLSDEEQAYYKLPELQANGHWKSGGLTYGINTQWVAFRRDIKNSVTGGIVNGAIDWGTSLQAGRYHLEPFVVYRQDAPWGYWSLKGRLMQTGYWLERQPSGVGDSTQRIIPSVSADGSLYFEREIQLLQNNYIQTLEPRIFFTASPTEEQVDIPVFDTAEYVFDMNQLYRDTRFSGVDRAGDLIKTSLGVTSRFIANSSGREQLTLNAGQAFYAKDRTVTTSSDPNDEVSYFHSRESSSLILQALWQPTDRLMAKVTRQWDYNKNRLERQDQQVAAVLPGDATLMVRHSRALSNCTLLGNCESDDETYSEVADLGLLYPFNDQWRTFFAHKQDLKNDTRLEQIAGVEYESCCWLVRLARHQWQTSSSTSTSDDSIGIQLVLKGFGGIGQKSSFAQMEEYIPGYTPITK